MNEITSEKTVCTTTNKTASNDIHDMYSMFIDPDYIPDPDSDNSSLSEDKNNQTIQLEVPDKSNRKDDDNDGRNSNADQTRLDQNIPDEEILHVGENRKRKKNNSGAWKKVTNKEKRMAGEEYMGYCRTKEGKMFHDTL